MISQSDDDWGKRVFPALDQAENHIAKTRSAVTWNAAYASIMQARAALQRAERIVLARSTTEHILPAQRNTSDTTNTEG